MPTEFANLVFKADSDEFVKAEGRINKTRKATTGLTSGMKKLAVAFGSAAVAAKLFSAFKSGIAVTANFSQEIANLSAITGATGKDLEFFSEQAKEIGKTTSLSASQAAIAFKLIASAKPELLDSAEALAAVTKQAVLLAEATGDSLPASAAALGAALNQFQLPASKAADVVNILAASSKLGTANVGLVTDALRNAGSAANALGLDLVDTVAGIQALAKANKLGADGGTSLRQVLLKLEETADRKLQPSIVGLSGALEELKSRNLSNQELMKMFGQEAFTASTILLAQKDVVAELGETMRKTNTATEQASIRMNTLTGDWLAFKSAIEAAQIRTFGGDIEDLSRFIVQMSTRLLNEGVSGLNLFEGEAEDASEAALGLAVNLFGFNDIAFGVIPMIAGWFNDTGDAAEDAEVAVSSLAETMASFQAGSRFKTEPTEKPTEEPKDLLEGKNVDALIAENDERQRTVEIERGRLDLIAGLDAAEQRRQSSALSSLESLQFLMMSEEDQIRESYARRLEIISEAEATRAGTEEEWAQARTDAAQERDQELLDVGLEKYSILLDGASAYFTNMEGKEAAFASAAISIGQEMLTEKGRQQLQDLWNSTYSGAMNAYSAMASIPVVGPALGAAAFAAVVAAGVGAAANIVTGGREVGGQMLPGNSYVVGERGPEVINTGSTGASVVPNNKLVAANSGGNIVEETNINISVQALDGKDAFAVIASQIDNIGGLLNAKRREKGMSAIV